MWQRVRPVVFGYAAATAASVLYCASSLPFATNRPLAWAVTLLGPVAPLTADGWAAFSIVALGWFSVPLAASSQPTGAGAARGAAGGALWIAAGVLWVWMAHVAG